MMLRISSFKRRQLPRRLLGSSLTLMAVGALVIVCWPTGRDARLMRELSGSWNVSTTLTSPGWQVVMLNDGTFAPRQSKMFNDHPEMIQRWRISGGKLVLTLNNTSIPWYERIRDFVPFAADSKYESVLAIQNITWLTKQRDTFSLSYAEPGGQTTVRFFQRAEPK